VEALELVDRWPTPTVAVGVTTAERTLATRGPADDVLAWASVTKTVTALAALVAVERGTIALDEPAGPPGSTVRHLLAHASGLSFSRPHVPPITKPGVKRMYSNVGFDTLAAHLAAKTGTPFPDYLRASVLDPLGMSAELRASPAWGLVGPLEDLLRLGRELLAPTLIRPEALAEATTVQFPGLPGSIATFRYDTLDWGLGFEVRGNQDAHWTGRRNSPRTFGHFGASGTFLWVDPDAGVACGCLTPIGPKEFIGEWILEAWPELADAVLDETTARAGSLET
jgi:CubicO group peptidase (beta-lactamase class C family)